MLDNGLHQWLFGLLMAMGILTMGMIFVYLFINLGVCG